MKLLKQWPEDGSPAAFEAITEPLVQLLRRCFTLTERFSPDATIPYDGYEGTLVGAATSFRASEHLTGERRAENAERGRGLDTIVMMIAVWVGMEQGRRVEKERQAPWLRLAQDFTGMIERADPETRAFALDKLRECLRKLEGRARPAE
jgi:hypothetical protein